MNEMTMVPTVAFPSAQGSDHQIWFQFIYIAEQTPFESLLIQ